ncbi:MAG: hypothetical protein OXC39_01545 [Candidatus Dadabacteria bacterium]|nr:hypothetical protein [Candidatus Dadabacteria bacterium]
MSGGRGGFVPISSSPHASPRNLIDAISEIQQYHIIERTGQDIPSDFLTVRGMLTFFMVGARSGFWEGVFLGLLLPLAWGVWEEVIPAFGGTADFFGKCLVFLFGFGISLMMTVILGGMLARYYGGNLTRKAVNSLVWGRTLSLIAKGVLVFLVFNLLVFLLSPRNVFFFCEAAKGFIGDPASLYFWIMAMKEPLRKSATTQLALSPVLSLIPFITLRFSGRG